VVVVAVVSCCGFLLLFLEELWFLGELWFLEELWFLAVVLTVILSCVDSATLTCSPSCCNIKKKKKSIISRQ